MVSQVNITDLLFLNEQVLLGENPPPGGDFLSPNGIRAIDGSNNNISNQLIVDQFGNIVHTDTFGTVDQQFVRWVDTATSPLALGVHGESAAFGAGPMAPGFPAITNNFSIDQNPRTVSNLIADASANNPAAVTSDVSNPGDPGQGVLPFNTLMTFFGQFFDHGLDFVNKGGSGTVWIPIMEGDELYKDPALFPDAFNFMPLTRGSLDADNEMTNSTAPFIEQSQTYGSRASTTFYLMEYDVNGEATGDLVSGVDGMATWADIKDNANTWARAQAGATGNEVMLTDAHAVDIPDPAFWNVATGSFDPGASTGQVFLADIAHGAAPNGVADADSIINPHGPGAPAPAPGTFDNELLDAHYIAGDGRANENVVLTSIHHAFHEEHSRILEMIKDWVQQQDEIEAGFAAGWTGENYFQAAKLINEMQYQHLVFEEFGRRISPNIDAFNSYDAAINPIITAEFAHAVYRLGHSMLTDNVTAANAAGQVTTETLVDSFLNPVLFSDVGAADFLKGAQIEAGAEIDEFVTGSLRNFLDGLSLDLAALNIARGREAGLGSLNQTRQELFDATGGDTSLKPYESWTEFGNNLLNPDSLVNFVAAYSHDAAIVLARAENRLDDARSLAQDKIDNDAAFMGSGAGRDMGLEDIDLWMGGLAEAKVVVGGVTGLLGSTFDFVFATQMIAMQDGDRFYYLGRLGGNILDQIEGQTFSDILMRGSGATHLGGDAFGTVDSYFELGSNGLTDYTVPDVVDEDHEVIGGTNAANTIVAGDGNDTLWGEGGDDILDGGLGDDHIYGGDGDDTIFGDDGVDFIRGDDGDDVIHAGTEDDAVAGGNGDDTIFGDAGADAILGGAGDDIIHGGTQDDELLGGDGHDTIFGDNGADALDGEAGNDVLFGGRGDDALVGGEGDDFLEGGQGADSLDGGVGGYDIASYESWNDGFATGTVGISGLTIDLQDSTLSTGDARDDTYLDIEEVRGSQHNDIILGTIDPLVPDAIFGGAGNDTIDGRDGDDTLSGQEGDDNIIGGLGTDTVIFAGDMAEYTITNVPGGLQVAHTGGDMSQGTDTVSGVEFLAFDDQIFTVGSLSTTPLIFLPDTVARIQNGSEVDAAVQSDVIFDGDEITSANGIFVSTIVINDPDGISNNSTTVLAGPDAGAFILVNTAAGQDLHFIGGGAGTNANYEAKPQYHVTVEVTDNSGFGSALNLTLDIQDVNDNAPVFTSGHRVNIQENTDPNVIIYRAETDDVDTVGGPVIYSLGGDDAPLFTLNNGELRFNNPADFETPLDTGGDNIYNVSINATDGTNVVDAPLDLAIHVQDQTAEGGNIAPVINTGASDLTPTLDEDMVFVGNIVATDVNMDTLTFSALGSDAPNNGTVVFSPGGQFNYLPNAEYSGLDQFVVTVSDGNGGTATIQVDLVIDPLNDPAIINGTLAGSVDEDGVDAPTIASGQATSTDVDNADNTFVAVASGTPSAMGYGTIQVLADGNWAYTLDDTNPTVNALNDGDPLSDSFIIMSEDGTPQSITISITGTNDAATIGGVLSGAVDEDGVDAPIIASGLATSLDVDNANNSFVAVAAGTASSMGYGTVEVLADGNWTYTLDDTNPTVDALNDGDPLSDSFVITSEDGSVQSVTISITGSTDIMLPVINGNNISETIDGTENAEIINGLGGHDIINALGGDDILDGGTGQDTLNGGDGDDTILGGFGNDTIDGGDGIDTVDYSGFGGNVTVNLNNNGSPQTSGGGGVDVINNVENIIGGDFADVLTGGVGDTIIHGGDGGDRIFGLGGGDMLFGEGDNDFIQGGNADDYLDGGADQDQLNGGDGNDTLMGGEDNSLDRLTGADGDDTLDGGGGRDILRGDSFVGGLNVTGGADIFDFNEVNDSTAGGMRDIVRDFVQGEDLMDLSDIDAIIGGSDDAFTFVGTAGFSGTAGELSYQFGGAHTIVSADVDGNGIADMQIQLNGNIDLLASDFIL